LALTSAFCLAFGAWPAPCASAADDPDSVATLKKLGARIQQDQNAPGKPVVYVSLFRKPVKDEDLAALEGIPDLRRLELVGTQVTDAGLVHLKGLKKLEALDLGEARLTDEGLAHLKDLKALKSLTRSGSAVRKNAIEGPGLAHLKEMPQLERLYLNYTGLTDKGLAALKPMKSLKVLAVSGTKVTPEGVADLRKALPGLEVRR
jgi:hypothetical protein